MKKKIYETVTANINNDGSPSIIAWRGKTFDSIPLYGEGGEIQTVAPVDPRHLAALVDAARAVPDAWERGDLAGAVRVLAAALAPFTPAPDPAPFSIGQLVRHVESGNCGFVRHLDPLTVEFSGPVTFTGYSPDELAPEPRQWGIFRKAVKTGLGDMPEQCLTRYGTEDEATEKLAGLLRQSDIYYMRELRPDETEERNHEEAMTAAFGPHMQG